ncbi:uncharacterized protein [Coffea arabica]|uniref:Uncharacterized protein isoform X2 n=1 Tax=Coffea arabica TaxID=13443 RepID=A0ABM4WK61_COFAR
MVGPDASDALAVRDTVQQFLNAARTGNLDLFKKLAKQLDDGKGIAQTVADVKDANKRGALHFAAREGKTDMCKYLVEELKLDVNAKDDDGETPLLHAARQGHAATAEYLTECGADPSIPSHLGAMALHHSAGIGDTELLKFLISRGVDVDLQSDAGTPLIWAAGHGQQDAVRILLEHRANAGAHVNVTAGGATPLHIAADHGSPEILECLLKAGANPDSLDEEGVKPIEVAAARGHRRAVEILFPVTSQIPTVSEWSVDGILEHVESETDKVKEVKQVNKQKAVSAPEVTPETRKKASEAKARGDEAFKRKDFSLAVDAYSQAIDFDPTDATLHSNRSLCWLRLGQADHALSDARACRALRPDWPKACYREGAALRLLQKFEEAASAFYEGVTLDPENKELVAAFREAVDAGRKFHEKEKEKS